MLVSYGSQGVAELEDGRRVQCIYKRSVGRPYCGDIVELEPADETQWSVTAVKERRNEFARVDRAGRKQIIASNLDRVLIVIAPKPAPSRDLVERYLVAVHSLGMTPVMVVNKSDLLTEELLSQDTAFGHLVAYQALGYRVARVSCTTAAGLEELMAVVSSGISILVGQSGVGKSSIANKLIPNLELQTGMLSRATGKGTHTTTTTIMYSIPGSAEVTQGRLVDSPGVWEYGLWEMSADELSHGFIEFIPYLGHCRFNDCQHASEPGCAIRDAVQENQILDWRYQAYRRLLAQSSTGK